MTRNKQPKQPVILVDDEEHILNSLSLYLRSHGITNVIALNSGRHLLECVKEHGATVIVLDLLMPFIAGKELLPQLRVHFPEIPVLVVTASDEVDTAVNCMKSGAFDYLVKPVEKSRFISAIKRASEFNSLKRQIGTLKKYLLDGELIHGEAFANIVTVSPKMKALFQYTEAIADSSEPALITGETGVGKELFARALHQLSGRPGAMVGVNVAGLDDNMFSDTLFGHHKGAFTGAGQGREGFIAKAGQGTLFLDEIGDLSPASQVKILRLLQENVFYPLGSDVPKNSQAHIIAATNCDLKAMMEKGDFRPDLYYRLSAHQVSIPPLRERKEDIPLLTACFLEEACIAMGKEPIEPSPELLTLLSAYHFPGNVRELRSLLFDAIAQHKTGSIIGMNSIKNKILATQKLSSTAPAQQALEAKITVAGKFPSLKEAETLIIQEALKQARGNQGIAATLLGISRPALNRRLKNLKQNKEEKEE